MQTGPVMCVGLGEEKVGLRGIGFQPAFTEAISHRERLHDISLAQSCSRFALEAEHGRLITEFWCVIINFK